MLLASLALAGDTWYPVTTGIERLYRTTSDPKIIQVVTVDLSRPEIYLRATREWENQQTVPSFATEVGATVAINGDWFSYDTYFPVGLAVGAGWGWTGNEDSADWSFFACNVDKRCWIDPWGNDAAWTPRAWNAVGGNSVLLVIDGVAQVNADAFYSSDLAPRSAVGISQDEQTLFLVVVDGRSSASEGATFNEMGALLLELGAYNAMMLDGGGSSTLWVQGSVLNTPSDGWPRTVSNHLAVMVSTSTDAECSALPNGKYCVDGTVLGTCEGGHFSSGDCGYYGLACEESGDFAYCVDPTCTNGGQQYYCVDATNIGRCEDGVVVGTGDCAAYGATCESSGGTAYCVDYRCGGDGNQGWCTDTLASTCTNGVYAEADCAASGLECAGGACVEPGTGETASPDTAPPETDRPVTDPTGATPGSARRLDGLAGCGCQSGESAPWGALFLAVPLLARARSTRRSRHG